MGESDAVDSQDEVGEVLTRTAGYLDTGELGMQLVKLGVYDNAELNSANKGRSMPVSIGKANAR